MTIYIYIESSLDSFSTLGDFCFILHVHLGKGNTVLKIAWLDDLPLIIVYMRGEMIKSASSRFEGKCFERVLMQ